MKRDLNLTRQLLLDIENQGTDCSVSVLQTGSNHQSEEHVRYHLRLLIDAGLLKEIDRTSAGVPCVRLTHDGHELLELVRSESRWREAKYACQERMGGQSLTVIRDILLRWAVATRARSLRYHRVPVARRLRYNTELPRERAADRLIDRDYWEDENVRYVDVRPELNGYHERYSRHGIDLNGDGQVDVEYESKLPGYLI